ncbi:MAG: hypothetical protein JO285_12915 [Kutzneria sp.]|nr:hypothetical protein [Kutzneria sp.]
MAELSLARGANVHLDAAVKRIGTELADLDGVAARSRRLVELMALTLQGSLLVRHAPSVVADAFCATRLGGDWGHTFGTLPASADVTAILDRAALSVTR